VLTTNCLQSQNELNNSQLHQISLDRDTILFSEGFIIPSSLQVIPDDCLKSVNLEILNKSLIISSLENKCKERDSIWVLFRSFPKLLEQKFCLIDSSSIINNDRVINIAADLGQNRGNQGDIIGSPGMDYRGSFSRGLSVGNNQDLVLNSNFDMTLQGDLGGGLKIKGVISDDNIPIQAEGNTQQLREFDKVFIELSKNQTYMRAGDYTLSEQDRYFTRYLKKLQGATLGHETKWREKRINSQASYAVSRGKFARQVLQVQDGNQGPYKLTGSAGERFLIVLSGTEKVYSDGKLLERGEQYDYVIDYNTAEVEFTFKQIINQFSRIIVEYEYTDQNFLRTVYAGDASAHGKNYSIGMNLYSEQDNTNVSGFAALDSTRIEILRQGGDDPTESVISGIFIPEEGDLDAVNYTLEVDAANGLQFLAYSEEKTSATVSAVFSEVDPLTGHYIIDEEIAINQRVYKYVGLNQGNYLPQIQLPTPTQKQLLNLYSELRTEKLGDLGAEIALSRSDLNRFSDIDNEDNDGIGITLNHRISKKLKSKSNWLIEAYTFAEYAGKNFKALNFYRAAEFNRIWSLDDIQESAEELLASFQLKTTFKNKLKWDYNFKHFTQKERYLGNKQSTSLSYEDSNWFLKGAVDYLKANSTLLQSDFLIPSLEIKNKTGEDGWSYGGYYNKESNTRLIKMNFLLNERSMEFERMGVFAGRQINKKLSSEIQYNRRIDWGIKEDKTAFTAASETDEYKLKIGWQAKEWTYLDLNATYRDFKVINPSVLNATSNKGFFGRMNQGFLFLNKGLKTESLIETGSGQEPKQEFKYLMVQQGEGSYIWNDYNQDSIQQVNEFEIAPFGDLGNFERFVVFNNEFIRTSKTEFKQLIDFRPSKFIDEKKKKLLWLTKLYWRTRFHVIKKTAGTSNSFIDVIDLSVNGPDIVSFIKNYDHTLFLNQGSSVFNGELSLRNNHTKVVLISGFEERQKESIFGRVRYNIKKVVDLSFEAEQGTRLSAAENYEAKNFIIDFYRWKPKIVWRASQSFRTSFAYQYGVQQSRDGEASTINQELSTDITWRRSNKSNLTAQLNYILNDFEGPSGTPIELDMLQGLKTGNNWLWSLNYTQRIAKSIDANFSYRGRQSDGSKTVHTLSAQMKILF